MSKEIEVIRKNLTAMNDQFKAALPAHVSVSKFTRTAMTAIQTTPALLKADRRSLFAELTKCAQEGLVPDGQEAAIVPFRDQAKYMPMVKGILKKVRNSGELASITAQLVYENDEFEFWIDSDGEHLNHKPKIFGERGKRIGVYALAKTKDGAVYIEVMTEDDIAAIRKSSRGNNTPWNGPFASEMEKKSAIRRLSKRLPMSTDLEMTVKADDDFYDFDEQQADKKTEEKVVAEKTETPSRLEEMLEGSEPIVDATAEDIPV
jgi:recombination protein RecT